MAGAEACTLLRLFNPFKPVAMKYFPLWITLLLLCCKMQAKTPDKVQQYAIWKNKAELCIIDSDYAGALQYYKAAFALRPAGQRDLYNAFVLAYLGKDTVAATAYYKELVLLGLTEQRLEMLKFGRLYKSDSLYRRLSLGYDSLRKVALNSAAFQYAQLMDSLFNADQAVRANYRGLSQEEIRVMIARDSANIACLKQLIAVKGFPGYRRTGLFEQAEEGWIHSNSTIFFILWHCRNLSTLLDGEALAAVHAGDLPPEDYALVMDSRRHHNRYYSRPQSADSSGLAAFDTVRETEAVIDARRATLGLCSLADYKRKLAFQNDNGMFYFFSAMHLALALSYIPFE